MKPTSTYFVYADDVLKYTVKTKKTAVKRANELLDTLLYRDVRIDRFFGVLMQTRPNF